jgi:hypothetical protein
VSGKWIAVGAAGLAALAGTLALVISASGSDTEPDQLENLFTPNCEAGNGIVDRGAEDLDHDELSLADDSHGGAFANALEAGDPEIVRISCEVGGSSLRHYEFDSEREARRATKVHRGGQTCLLSETSFFDGPGNKLREFCAELGGNVVLSAGARPRHR